MTVAVEHLTKHFGKFAALQDVSFDVRPGEVFALLGPNGSGKTTTLKSIVGLSTPTSGRVLIDGIDAHRSPREAKSRMSYLPQHVVFPESITAREIVRFYAQVRHLPRRFADDVLARAQFNGASDRPVGEFSGGMVQRLALAIVSMPDAPLLLLDEPTASLDPVGVKRFRDFVLDLKSRGKTVIFSTHLLAEVEQLADRAGIFVGGKLVAIPSIDELRRSFSNSGTIEDMYLHFVGQHDDEHR